MIPDTLLSRFPLFAFLSKADQQSLVQDILEIPYKKGEYIFREGDPADWFHIVKEGTVKCVKSSPDGRDVTLKFLTAGDLFCCEAATLEGSCHPGCAKVLEPATIVKIPKKRYWEILRRNPDMALEVIQYLGERLREAQETAKAMVFHKAERRLAAVLATLAEKTGIPESEGIRLATKVTRRDLADMSGLTVETATRLMSRFKAQHLVTGTAKRLLIRNLNALKAIAYSPVTADSHSPSSVSSACRPR
ncbi:MAG: Crp/Fnr family transcriptional regulator [Nitrospirae bacterium]|nr:MAG: Crp/Fnr family transcriptional regulator [Nitrospirota bacterium]